jgi:hypothetical protein
MSTTPVPASGQFLRFAQLLVTNESQQTVTDLSGLRFRFEVRSSDLETPNTAVIRVYNASSKTVNTIINGGMGSGLDDGANFVTLSAGYQNGNQGVIFQGDIKQFRFGKEGNVDTYLDILAGDGDQAYNESIVNQTLPKGTNDTQQLAAIAASMNIPVSPQAQGALTTGGILPRGKTLFGMSRIHMRDLADKNDCRWSIQNGVLTIIPNTGYLSGDIVNINTASGMIGAPEATDNGITVRCYLNPLIKIGQRVQINNADINQTIVKAQSFPAYTSLFYPATTSNDGVYRVLVAEHIGDTRSNSWYTDLTCLSIDQSSSQNSSVQSNG